MHGHIKQHTFGVVLPMKKRWELTVGTIRVTILYTLDHIEYAILPLFHLFWPTDVWDLTFHNIIIDTRCKLLYKKMQNL